MHLSYRTVLRTVFDDEANVRVLEQLVATVKNTGDFRVAPYMTASIIVRLIDEIKRLREEALQQAGAEDL